MIPSSELQEVPATEPLSGSGPEEYTGCFQSRELSWLQFNLRVLAQAEDERVPLLERLKFLSIYQHNLDEFFMVRVGSLTHRSVLLPHAVDRKTGWTAAKELHEVLCAVGQQQKAVEKVWHRLAGDLKAAGIEVLNFNHLSPEDEAAAKKLFAGLRPQLEAVLVDARHPFPFLAGGESVVAVLLQRDEKTDGAVLGLVPFSRVPDYQITENDGVQQVILTSELVCHFAGQLFPGQTVLESSIIRLTRNADVFLENIGADTADMRESMKKLLHRRKREQPVRLQMSGKPSHRFRLLLQKELKLPEANIFVSKVPAALGFGSLLNVPAEMKYASRRPVRSVELKKGEYFRYLEKHDLLLSFPYQSFAPFIELIYEAADDPEVVSVQITLYRLGAASKLASALAYAADHGKQVLCLLELRARFDEQNNIDYSEMLEKAGCTVIYGLPDQKVHSKLCLITRQKGQTVRYITQVGTGNYNDSTCEQYCDLSLITSDAEIGQDASAVFEALARGQTPAPASRLWVAPESFKPRLMELLDREIAKGTQGRVAIKVNSMNDLDVMKKLMECSCAGVQVELFIRGICCLLPGIPGKTENIQVKSVVGRYLEHSRVFVFGSGENQRVFLGSGDLLNRNTRRRVEAFIEVTTPGTRDQVLKVMEAFRQDDSFGWSMYPDGSFGKPSGTGPGSQDVLYDYFSQQLVRPDPKGSVFRSLFARLKAWWKSLF